MLAKSSRLSDSQDISLVKSKGKLLSTPHFSILLYQADKVEILKFGIIASKKLSNSAVTRNEIKRKANRVFLPFFKELPPCYILMLPTKTFHKADEGQLSMDLVKILQPFVKTQ